MMPFTGYLYYGARIYDTSIGRFTSVDPLADQFPSWNPYHYVHNNPLKYTDPTGMAAEGVENEYEITTNDDGTTITKYVSDKGGDETDYITWKDSEGNTLGETQVDVSVNYTSGPGTLQKDNPTPGFREEHGKNHTDVLAYGVLLQAFTGLNGNSAGIGNLGFASKSSKVLNNTKKLSKVKKSKVVESFGDYTKTTKVAPGKGPGQSRSVMTYFNNAAGKVVRSFKDSYDRANKFMHRKPLRGGPEGRPPSG